MSREVQELRGAARGLYLAFLGHESRQTPQALGWAATMILSRSVECLESIELLVGFGRDRDAGVLLVSLMELSLDIRFLSGNVTRAELWLSHAESGKKPWRVSDLVRELHPDADDRESVEANYRYFSMIKHGNPVSVQGGFPLAVRESKLFLPTGDRPRLLMSYLFAGSLTCTQVAEAAVACFDVLSSALREGLAHVKGHNDAIGRQMEAAIIAIVQAGHLRPEA
jgi:hypothetical protein